MRRAKSQLDEGIKGLLRAIDQNLAEAAFYLRRLDEPTYNRMRSSHRDVLKSALSGIDQHRHADAHKAWFAKDPSRARTLSFRIGGIESVVGVSISTGEGTSYYYDEGDDGHYYSMILVLGVGIF
ncbi:hypothetical protein GMOD_00005368 [Pyrenophora seminiperda CCB06]|uniref:Uncharacterized protein n=1 Tax=Pyrenophora seminiperda CCB06 TaxID=1302712 RepID=A0A3M7LVQ5_9PLEO|nr:hypothetical protein GMOD_00005368 [Pyrenophora seminiperda CCB06]